MSVSAAALPGPQEDTPIPPPSTEEEEAIILSRITNDERALRRIVKKFNTYTSLAFPSSSPYPSTSSTTTTIEDARDAFLVELASFSLQLKKATMVCEAEARQVEEYQRERQRIEEERIALRRHIEQLKTSLEDAQVERQRKIEYDKWAININHFDSRAELEAGIKYLENDIAAIRNDFDVQKRALGEQRQAFKSVVANLAMLQLTGLAPVETPRDGTPVAGAVERDVPASSPLPPLDDEREEGEEGESSDDAPLSASLNPRARPFALEGRAPSVPVLSVPAVRGLREKRPVASAPVSAAPSPAPSRPDAIDDDIEMGELTEPKPALRDSRGKKPVEELEEGEASDVSDLTDLPDD